MTDEPPRDAPAAPAAAESPVDRPTALTAPRDGTPAPVAAPAQLSALVDRFAAGTGPVALDAERASGYRYSQRAYLVQLRREGAGTALVDPIAVPRLDELDAAIADAEWVLHAANQDLPCLAELGLKPRRLFDTELAARLAGLERVGLASLTETLLGFALEKHHSAADWSTRPLPESWLAYAALDVELLLDLRDALDQILREQGKQEWAAEEFAAVVRWGGQPPRQRGEQWRRTSGMHRLRGPRAQARVRAMWQARDQLARRRDTAPGRILPDAALVAAAEADPRDERELLAISGFNGRATRRLAKVWLDALAEARALADDALPTPPAADGPPPPHRWAERDPAAAARLARCRQAVTTIAGTLELPPENLISPDSVRRLAWTPPEEVTRDAVAAQLRGFGAREWQVKQVAADLAVALTDV